jgi:hypothetical protein
MQIVMSTSRKIYVPNALLLISDIGGGTLPDTMLGELIASTPSCIAVGCMSDSNGKTEVTLGTGREFHPRGAPAFDGELETASRVVGICTVFHEPVLQTAVSNPTTRVRVWVNHPSEPDEVIVAVE